MQLVDNSKHWEFVTHGPTSDLLNEWQLFVKLHGHRSTVKVVKELEAKNELEKNEKGDGKREGEKWEIFHPTLYDWYFWIREEGEKGPWYYERLRSSSLNIKRHNKSSSEPNTFNKKNMDCRYNYKLQRYIRHHCSRHIDAFERKTCQTS